MSSFDRSRPPRDLETACRDEGYRARLSRRDRASCTYTHDDLREPWLEGWDAADAEMNAKEKSNG